MVKKALRECWTVAETLTVKAREIQQARWKWFMTLLSYTHLLSVHHVVSSFCYVFSSSIRTNSGVISLWIDISPTHSLQSPSLSSTTAQLAVGSIVDIWLPRVASCGNVCRRKSPFWSLPNAEINDTAPWSLYKPSAMFLPTPPPENFVSDLYVAPFSCGGEREKRKGNS